MRRALLLILALAMPTTALATPVQFTLTLTDPVWGVLPGHLSIETTDVLEAPHNAYLSDFGLDVSGLPAVQRDVLTRSRLGAGGGGSPREQGPFPNYNFFTLTDGLASGQFHDTVECFFNCRMVNLALGGSSGVLGMWVSAQSLTNPGTLEIVEFSGTFALTPLTDPAVTPVPEPATLTLLALGLGTALRSRQVRARMTASSR